VVENRQIDCCPLVLIEWEDSVQPVPGWHPVAAYKSVEAIKCVSVGWLICDTVDVKALAPNFADVNDPDEIQASGVIRIPTRAVRRIVPLTEEGLTSPCATEAISAAATPADPAAALEPHPTPFEPPSC
jgi:hypothetical protein